MIAPIRDRILVQLDPIVMKQGVLFLPDQKFIRVCRRCHQRAEALTDNPRCPAGRDDFGWDDYHDRPRYRGRDESHDIEAVTAPVVPSMSRIGTVISTGPRVKFIHSGDRVVIDFAAGGSLEDLRLVKEEVVLATVES